MIISQLKSVIGRNIINMPGWRSNRKIVVIESDDWGSIRMPSEDVYNKLLDLGIQVDKLSFNRYDSLASEEDLLALFDILTKFKDINGNNPVITANVIVANPDFEKVRESNFTEYHYENFTETLKKYSKHKGSFKLWQEGMDAGIFHPQFHGREHVNVSRWMKALREDIGHIRLAFDNKMFDLSRDGNFISENSFMDSNSYNNEKEFDIVKNSIVEGTKIFEDIFGFRSKSFISTCYIWDTNLESILADCGIKFIQGGVFQKKPIPGKINSYNRKFHFTGQLNKHNQMYLVRNCYFEPSDTSTVGLINNCLGRISTIFRWRKPVIISSHRMNYIGYIVPENRSRNLKLLEELLSKIIKLFPEVEFMTSDQLGELMLSERILDQYE